MKTLTYTKYLETIIISLLKERGDGEVRVDDEFACISLKNSTISPVNILSEIQFQREKRSCFNASTD
jgi:hypothetical protein